MAVRLSRPLEAGEAAAADRFGKITERSPERLVFQVPQGTLRDGVAHLLAELPVADLTIEDPPLEEVMRELFAAPATP